MTGRRYNQSTNRREGSVTNIEHRRNFIINVVYVALILAIVLLTVKYVLGLIWPFFLAFLFSWCMTPLIRWMTVKCHVKRPIAAIICLLLFFTVLGGLLAVLTVSAVSGLQNLVVFLPQLYRNNIEPWLQSAMDWAMHFSERLGPDAYEIVTSAIPNIVSSIGNAVTSFSMRAVGVVSGLVTKLPSMLLSTLICVIATVFMTLDFHKMTAFLLRQLPARARHVTVKAKETFVSVVLKYGKSYGIIMGVTFCELLVGLLLLRQQQAPLLALIIAVFDIFPVVGAGFILIPWGIITLLSGSIAKGLGLLALYIVITIIRQFMEPRVVGHQVGLHPLVTLIAMLVGTKLFGGIGLLGLPIACAILKNLDDSGVIHLLRREGAPAPAAAAAEAAPETAPEPPEKN